MKGKKLVVDEGVMNISEIASKIRTLEKCVRKSTWTMATLSLKKRENRIWHTMDEDQQESLLDKMEETEGELKSYKDQLSGYYNVLGGRVRDY